MPAPAHEVEHQRRAASLPDAVKGDVESHGIGFFVKEYDPCRGKSEPGSCGSNLNILNFRIGPIKHLSIQLSSVTSGMQIPLDL